MVDGDVLPGPGQQTLLPGQEHPHRGGGGEARPRVVQLVGERHLRLEKMSMIFLEKFAIIEEWYKHLLVM